MSKRFKGGTCAYCGDAGETGDHVFARGFFPVSSRADLPQVSACEACNRSKSELEHYLLSVLPFGSRHDKAGSMLSEMVPGRLAKNQKLHRELAEGQLPIELLEGDERHPSMALPIDGTRLYDYMRYVVRGLASHHFGVVIPATYAVSAGHVIEEHDAILRRLFVGRSNAYARGLGDDLILYEAQQAIDDPHLTMWRFLLYSGLVFTDGEHGSEAIRPDIWVITAKQPMPGLTED